MYHDQHPIIIEIKSASKTSSGSLMNKTGYKSRIKLAKEYFSDYDKPYYLKIRASNVDHKSVLESRFSDHRKMVNNSASFLINWKDDLVKARYKAIERQEKQGQKIY